MESTQTSVTAEEIRRWCLHVVEAPVEAADPELVDQLRELEVLKAAVEARQARIALRFDSSQRAHAAARGVPAARQARGIAEQVALARRVSPHRGRILLGLAGVVLREMPCTARAWQTGRITERRALVLARETACLTREDRARVDRTLAADADALEGKSDRQTEGEARALSARLDAAAVAERRRRAENERCVTLRPAPDSMVYLTALLPVAAGVAAYAALKRAADAAVGTGQARGVGQAMADGLVRRVTGVPEAGDKPIVPVAVNLVMSDRALLEGADEDAELDGYGPIPVGLARELVADNLDARVRVWIRRLYAHPLVGRLVAMDADQRLFPRQLADFIGLRDRFCRNPWCNARIRHRDHVRPVEAGGATTVTNGQGLCEQCNHAKQAPGWRHDVVDDPGRTHTVEVTTPTGHTYRSQAPPAPGTGAEIRLDLTFAA